MIRTAHGIAVAVAIALATFPLPAIAQRATLRPSDRAVVRVVGIHAEGLASIGTGFFVSETGLIATASHVVAGSHVLFGVSAATGDVFRLSVRVLDVPTDVAILEAAGVTPPATVSMGGPVPEVVAGDAVSASGYSGDEMNQLAPAISFGHISRSRSDGSMELDAVVNPGQSGGPVLSANGELLGLVSARSDPASGIIGIALIRPREEITAQLARATPRPVPPAPELTRLVAARAGVLVLSALTWADVETALVSARNPYEYGEALVAAQSFFDDHHDATSESALHARARGFASHYPQLFVLYPSLARMVAND